MNQLINLATIEIAEKTDHLSKIVVSAENAKECEELRKETNAYIKSVKTQIENQKAEFLKEFTKAEEAALEILAPLERAAKTFSAQVLEVNKATFQKKVQERFMELAGLSPDGEIPEFDRVYDPSWYGKAQKVWEPLLIAKLRDFYQRNDMRTVAYFFDLITPTQDKEIEAFLINNLIAYRKEQLK